MKCRHCDVEMLQTRYDEKHCPGCGFLDYSEVGQNIFALRGQHTIEEAKRKEEEE